MPLAVGVHITASQLAVVWNDTVTVGANLSLTWVDRAAVGKETDLLWRYVLQSAHSELTLDWAIKQAVGNDIELEWQDHPYRWTEIYQAVLGVLNAEADGSQFTLLMPSQYTTFLWRGRQMVLSPVTVLRAGSSAVLHSDTARHVGRIAVPTFPTAHPGGRTMTLT